MTPNRLPLRLKESRKENGKGKEMKKAKGKVLSISDDGKTLKIEYANKKPLRWNYKKNFDLILDEDRVPDEVAFQILEGYPENLCHPLVLGKIRLWRGILKGVLYGRNPLEHPPTYAEKNKAENNLKRIGIVLASTKDRRESGLDLGFMAFTRDSIYKTLKARRREFPRNEAPKRKFLNELFSIRIDDVSFPTALPTALGDLADLITAIKHEVKPSTVKQYRKQTPTNLIRAAKGRKKYEVLMRRLQKSEAD